MKQSIDLSPSERSELRPTRTYHTAYEAFWSAINWKLPDGILSNVWLTDRGNIRARRARLRKGPPRWRQRRDRGHPVFLAAIALEKLKSKKFTGLRPAGPYRESQGKNMPIPAQIGLELLSHDDGAPSFCLTIELLNAVGKSLTATIALDHNNENALIKSEVDNVGLQVHDRHALVMAAFHKMIRFHGEGPTGGTIQFSRWIVPDITGWVRLSVYRPTAGRILRAMRKLQPVATISSVTKEFSESVEV